jgi:hypothetical protein
METMKTTQINNTSATSKKAYSAPQVEKVALDHEISMVMMSNPPGESPFPQQDPLMSLKGFIFFS